MIVRAFLTVPGGWAASQTFAGRVMREKEDAERCRERTQEEGRRSARASVYADRRVNDRLYNRVTPVRHPRARLRACVCVCVYGREWAWSAHHGVMIRPIGMYIYVYM